jgi:hypothetical protein
MRVQSTIVNLLCLAVAAKRVGATAANSQKGPNDHLPTLSEDIVTDSEGSLGGGGADEDLDDDARLRPQIGRLPNSVDSMFADLNDQADPPSPWATPLPPPAPGLSPTPPAPGWLSGGSFLGNLLNPFGFGAGGYNSSRPGAGPRPPPIVPPGASNPQLLTQGQPIPPGWVPYYTITPTAAPSASYNPAATGATQTVTSVSLVTVTQPGVTSISILPGSTLTIKGEWIV